MDEHGMSIVADDGEEPSDDLEHEEKWESEMDMNTSQGGGNRSFWEESDTALKTYLRDIRKVRLLTREEEVEIAKRIEKSKWVERQRKKLDLLKRKGNRANCRELAQKIMRAAQDAERARQELILSNLRLVVNIAKKYTNRGLSLMDLIQEGNLGLIRAVEKYDFQMGNKFSTYAVWWIKQAVIRAIADKGRVIRVPVHMVEIYNQVVKHAREITQKGRHEATPQEIADRMEISLEKVVDALKVASTPVPLEKPIGEEEESTLAQFINDTNAVSPVDEMMTKDMARQVRDGLRTLSPREERVLRMRFGIDEPHRYTLDEVGHAFSVTRERIRQIEANALRKLRQSTHWRDLRDLVANN